MIGTAAASPAVTALVRTQSTNRVWRGERAESTVTSIDSAYFSAIWCFLMFNVFDAVGRVVASRVLIVSFRQFGVAQHSQQYF